MSLNIKSAEVHRMVSQLAHLRGQSLTQAVADAVRRALEEEMRLSSNDGLSEELLAIGRRCARHVDSALTSSNHAEHLFDEEGLP